MRSKVFFAALMAFGISAVMIVTNHFQPGKSEESKEIDEEETSEKEEYGEDEKKPGRQSGADKQLQTWFWQKGYPNPENLGQKYLQAWEQHLDLKKNTEKLLSATNTRTSAFGSWSSLGSVANIGGRVLSIATDPNNPTSNLFIGTASGGIYKSTNGGSSWSYVNTGHPVLGVSSITYHPTNSNILLAGTGEVYRVEGSTDRGNIGFNVWKCRGTYGIGILRSTDGGTTWTNVMPKISSDLFAIQDITFNPTNANEVFACATDGLYKSTNGGVTWSLLYAKTYVRDIAIHPTNSQIMVISVGNLSNTDKGLYRTTNGGTSWSLISGLPTGMTGYTKLANNGTRLYAAFGIAGTANELYMSTDFGATWIAKTGSDHTGGQYWFGHDLDVDPSNADRVIMGGVSYYTYVSSSTTTSAGTRTAIGSGMHADVHDIRFLPAPNNNIVFVANDGGMYKSTNGGSTYTAINNGLNAVQFYASFAVSPTNANVMIGGLQDNGTVKYDNGSWISGVTGGDGGPAMFHPTDGNRVLYSNDARAVYLSTDAGSSDVQKMLNLGYGYASPYDDRTAFMSPMAISNPATTGARTIMYVASDNLHISLDSGNSFSRVSPTGTGTAGMTRAIDLTYKPAIAMAVSPQNRSKLYVSTSPLSQRADDGLNYNPPAKVMVSTNANDNVNYAFANISGTLPDRFTTDFAISKFSDDSIYITMGGFGGGHVYLSPNGGTTWINRSAGLPDVPFNAILIDPVRPSVIYAASDFGVYVSPDRGVTWYDFGNGFWENTMVMDLQITADKQIVAATHGKGVFRSALFTPPATLPVKFESFTGQKQTSANQLTWNVSGERELKHYEVEASTDGIRYKKITTVSANNSGITTYQYSDRSQHVSAPVVHYRLKAILANEAYYYSDVVILKNTQTTRFKVLGNPFSTHVSFRYEARVNAKMTLQLSDMSGRVIRTETQSIHAGVGYYTVSNLSGLAKGQYVLRINAGSEQYTERLIKQ